VKKSARLLVSLGLIVSVFSPIQATAVSSNPTPNCSAGTTCTITFAFTGDYYAWTVPAGVTSLTVDLYGAQGGSGGSAGGRGGRIQGTLSVTAGSTIYVYVGGQSGYNGGGAAGTGSGSSTFQSFPGGGATDIRIGGLNYSNRVAVAGGGGGAGRNSCTGQTGGGGGYPGGLGGAGDTTKLGGDGTLTNGGSVNGSTTGGAGACSTSPHGGGGGGQNGGGASGGYATVSGGSNGGCGQTSEASAGPITGFTAGCFGTGGNGGSNSNNGGGGGGGGWYGGGAGGANWASGGGGGSSYLGSMTGTSFVNATRTGDGVASITYLNSPSPTTFSTSQTSPTNIGTGSTVSYSLVLSQSVSDLTTSDFQFGGTSTCNTPGLSGSGTTYTVTVTNCTEGTLILQLKANSITGTSTGPPSVSSANTVIIDRTAPTIGTVTGPANVTYIPLGTPTFLVAFSESVTVTGTPRLTLTVGSTTEYANYLSMVDSRTARFRYTVALDPVEFDTDGISLATSLDLNSGTIRDLATNALTNTSLTAPTLSSVLVAQPPAAPTIDSITATSGTLTVYFTAGAARGSTTSNYEFSTNNGGAWSTRSPVATTSPLVISGLNNGQGYQVRLRAIANAGTTSDSSTVVNETPTAVSVTGDSTLALTYGSSASTSAYSATGGTGIYTWSLGSTLTGITLSGTTVTAGATTPAGTYSQTVRATDGNSQVGTRSLTITVNKASTTITIALPNSATSAALGGAVTITATVPRAGAVNFRLGGSTISGCGSATAATTTATCSWTPASLGSVSLTAIFTPTDISNFETSTSTTLSITVVNGVSTVSLSLTGGATTAPKGQAINIIAAIDQAGRVSFFVDGKRVPGCINRAASVGNVSCSWKPAVQKAVTISARLTPTNNVYNASTSSMNVAVVRRSGAR
jgi:hypothetical protein